jgi:hypothetical protein
MTINLFKKDAFAGAPCRINNYVMQVNYGGR